MKNTEKAKIILDSLDEKISVNWNFEHMYLQAITEALIKIDCMERECLEK